MKKNLMKRSACLAAAALILTLGLTAGKAMAYFTTYATAAGTVTVTMGTSTVRVDEEVDGLTKHVRIVNTGDYDCYIRVRALAGEAYTLTYADDSGKWLDGGDGYYYYGDIVAPGGVTEKIVVDIALPDWMSNPEEEDSFNVVIVAECVPVLDGQDGPQWDLAVSGQD